MVKYFIFLINFFISFYCLAQNVGQKGGDTAVWNYTDINGMKQGKWLKFDKVKKKKLYEGFFINNRPSGEFKRYHPNGKNSAVLFYDKKSEKIKAKFFYDTGTLAAEGNYVKENVKDSTWNYYGTDKALIVKETYINGKRNGISNKYFRAKDKNGILIKSEEIEYKNDLKEGIWRQNFESGKPKLETTYVKDTVDGFYTFYMESGKVYCKGLYKKGLKEGTWTYSDESGVITEIKYKKGVPLNNSEISKKIESEMKKLQENSKNLKDPEKMKNSPEQYFNGQ